MNNKCLGKRLSFLSADLLSIKVTTLLTVGLVTFASANSFGQRIRLNAKNQQVKSVLQQIEEQSGYSFIYDASILSGGKAISLSLQDESVEVAMAKLAKQLHVDYSIVNKTVTLTNIGSSSQEQITINGTVILMEDNVKTKVAGVSINVKGTSKGTATNNLGEFKITVDSEAILVFSFIGYEKVELKAKEFVKNPFVQLFKGSDYIDEVIVTAYGTKESRENQVGSAYTITSKDLEKRPALRIDALLEGVVPGVEFGDQSGTTSSARPRYSTNIRGEASAFGGAVSSEPLWVVDGVPLYTGGTTNMITGVSTSVSPLTYLNTDDIESITVLKDASATSIYGANGSNGVVLITTKKGKGDPKVRYSYRGGITNQSKYDFKVLDASQYLQIVEEMGMTSQLGKLDLTQNTDWRDVYFRTGSTQIHNLSLSGSSDRTNYFISGNFYNEKLPVIANDTKRYSFRTNVNTAFSKRFTLETSIGTSYNTNSFFNSGNRYYLYSPLVSPYNSDGSYAFYDLNGNLLQYTIGEAAQNDNNQKAFAILGHVGLTADLGKGFNVNSDIGVDISSLNEDIYLSMNNPTGKSDKGRAEKAQVQVYNIISTSSLNYNRDIGDHSLGGLISMEARKVAQDNVSAYGTNFPNDNIRNVNFVALANRRGSGSSDLTTQLSYFGRLSYVYKKRYAAIFNYRKDGSSNFGKDVKWGTFSSIGAAWTVSNEEFWKFELIDFLKFKLTFGSTGNSRFNSAYAKGLYRYSTDVSYGGDAGVEMYRGVNDGLKWETTNTLNAGVDFRIAKKFTVGLEWYDKVTHDLIDNSYVSMVSGWRNTYQNIGKIRNRGFEANLSSNNIEKENFSWNTTFILSLNRNKMLELAGGVDRSTGNSIAREGYHSRSFYLVRWAGVDPSTGNPMWYDLDGNITMQYNANNRVIVGNPDADFYGGFTNRLRYKSFNLSFFMKYRSGGYKLDEMSRLAGADGLNILEGNQSINLLNHWQYPGQLATEPRLSNISTQSTLYSTRYLISRTNLSLDNISLSYDFARSFVKRLRLSGLSVYGQIDNIAIWTPYNGKKGSANYYETEGEQKQVRNTLSNVISATPQYQTISFGLNVGF